MGCGSGTLGLTRSYSAEKTEPANRTNHLAILTALQYAGFAISPVIGSALAAAGNYVSVYWVYALPAYFISLLALYCICSLVSGSFQNLDRIDKPDNLAPIPPVFSPLSSSPEEIPTISPVEGGDGISDASQIWYSSPIVLVVSFLVLNATTKGSISVYETIGSQIATVDYEMSKSTLGLIVSISGVVGFVQLIYFKEIYTNRVSDVTIMLGGIAIMIVAQLLMISFNDESASVSVNRYVCSLILMYAFGYPIGHTAVLGAFSKVKKAEPQAALMGYFAAAGSLARIVVPIVSGYMDSYADNSPFCANLFILSLSYLSILVLAEKINRTCNTDRLVQPIWDGLRVDTLTRCSSVASLEWWWWWIQVFGALAMMLLAIVVLIVKSNRHVSVDSENAASGIEGRI